MALLGMIIVGWIAASLAFGLLWVATAAVMKEARRRMPQLAVDPSWRASAGTWRGERTLTSELR